jgi:hypothetical protein
MAFLKECFVSDMSSSGTLASMVMANTPLQQRSTQNISQIRKVTKEQSVTVYIMFHRNS